MSIEEMEIQRDGLYKDYLDSIGKPEEKEILKKLGLMDEILDAMEGYEAEDEDLNTSANWDEWYIDNQIDRMREDEYEL